MFLKAKIILAAAVVSLVAGALCEAGLVDTRKVPQLSFLLPFGVILAGMFLIVRLFEKESKVAVDDQQAALKREGMNVPRSQTPAKQGAIMAQ